MERTYDEFQPTLTIRNRTRLKVYNNAFRNSLQVDSVKYLGILFDCIILKTPIQ